MKYQVFVYDERSKSVRVGGGMSYEQAEKLSNDCDGWIEEEQ